MGNKDQDTIGRLRFQSYQNGNIHVHDDAAGTKFIGNQRDFKSSIEDAFKDLEISEGVVKVEADSGDDLYIIKDGKNYGAFVAGKKSIKTELKSFVDKL